jgi:hypothetical protein
VKKITVYDLDDNIIKVFKSKLEAKKYLQIGYYTLEEILDNIIIYEDINLNFNTEKVNISTKL